MLILEPTKVYQPSYVSINNQAEEKNVSIWHVSPPETVRTKTFVFFYVNSLDEVTDGALVLSVKFLDFSDLRTSVSQLVYID